jgi:hypothetical protein
MEAENIPVLDKFEYLDLAIALARSMPLENSPKLNNQAINLTLVSDITLPPEADDELVMKFQRQSNIGWRQFNQRCSPISDDRAFHEDYEKVDKFDPTLESPPSLPENSANALETRFNRLLISPNNGDVSQTNAERHELCSLTPTDTGSSPHSAGAMSNNSRTDIWVSKYGSLHPETSNLRYISPDLTTNQLATDCNRQVRKSLMNVDLEVDTGSSHGESETDFTGENNGEPTDRPEFLKALKTVGSLQHERLAAAKPLLTMAK